MQINVGIRTDFIVECLINSFDLSPVSNQKNLLTRREIKGIDNTPDSETDSHAYIYLYYCTTKNTRV